MTRIIQDSDDEYGSSSPLKLDDTENQAPGIDEGVPKAVSPGIHSTKPTNSKSSDESLQQEIEQAHLQLFGNSQSLKRRRENGSSDATNYLETDPIKRTKRKSSAEFSQVIQGSENQKSTKFYGSSNRRLHDLFDNTNPQFDALKRDDNANPGSESTSGETKLSFGFSDSSESAKWDLPQSARDDFARNDPSMFPEASSTVPDNTLDQQRMIDAAVAEQYSMLAPPNIPVRYSSSSTGSSSIPWSAYLATQNKSQASQNLAPPITGIKERSEQPGISVVGEPRSTEDMELSHTPVGSPTPAGILLGLDPLQQTDNPEQVPVDGSSREVASASKSKKKRQREEDELSRSDELAISLPTEQYKPRPSRSRSAQMVSEPIDLSIAPEKTARKRPKRSKTADSLVDAAQRPFSIKVEAMGEMGFTPNRSRLALTESGGNLEDAIDDLLRRSRSERVSAQSHEQTPNGDVIPGEIPTDADVRDHDEDATSNRNDMPHLHLQTRRELVAVEILQAHAPLLQHHDAIDTTSGTYVTAQEGIRSREKSLDVTEQKTVTSSTSSPRKGKKKKAASREGQLYSEAASTVPANFATSHESPHEIPTASPANEIPPKQPKGKKRRRGRPRKASKAVVKDAEAAEEKVDSTSTNGTSAEMEGDADHEPLQEVDANTKTSSGDPGSMKTESLNLKPEDVPAENAPSPQSILPQTETPPEAAKTTSASRSAASQSPVTKGKVPYRVGLSRRARIAPLLKTVKK